jgi:hypothetical protein
MALDIHILLNTIHSPSVLNSLSSTSTIPVCLPKFNPAGFVNAYISFLRKDSLTPRPDDPAGRKAPYTTHGNMQNLEDGSDAGITLVCISGGSEFEAIREWCDGVTKVRLPLSFL